MKLFITGWKAEGLRCPDMDFTCEKKGSPAKVVLFQMPNATAKTTFVNLIKSALSNKLIGGQPMKYIDPKGPENQTKGMFELSMLLKEGASSKVFKIRIDFDFNAYIDDKFRCEFTTYRQGIGWDDDWSPPSALRNYLKQENINIFSMEGHKSAELINKNPDQAIDAFCGINDVKRLIQHLEDYYTDKAKQAGGTKAARGFKVKQTKLNKAKAHLDSLREERKENVKSIQQTYKSVKELDKKIKKDKDYNDKLSQDIDKLKVYLKTARAAEDKNAKAFFKRMRNPAFLSPVLSKSMKKFKANLKELQLPEDVGRPWFNELVSSENCICGRPMTKDAKSHINKRKKELLEESYQATLQTFKTNADNFLPESADKQDALKQFKNSIDQANKIDRDLKEKLQDQVDAQNEEIKEWIKIRKEHINELYKLKKQQDDLDEKENAGDLELAMNNFRSEKSISLMTKVVDKLKKDFSSTLGVQELLEKKERLEKILKEVIEVSRMNIKDDLKKLVNKKIEKVFPDDLTFRVETITDKIKLMYNKDSGSGGEVRSTAYFFTAGLLARSPHSFPLIVDHPTAELDDVRRADLADYAPASFEQVLFFITKNEKEDFVSYMQGNKKLAPHICYATLFKNLDLPGYKSSIKALPKKDGMVQKTRNGILCYDQKFFDAFTLLEKRKGN